MGRLLYNAQEAAEIIGISRASFYRIARPHLRHVKIAGSVRFRADDLKAFIEARTVEPSADAESGNV